MTDYIPEFHPNEVFYGDDGLSANLYQCRDTQGIFYKATYQRVFHDDGVWKATRRIAKEHRPSLWPLVHRIRKRIQEMKRTEESDYRALIH